MDQINTWCRLAVLSAALLWSFQAGASSLDLEMLANEAARHANLTNLIIVGVSHDNVRLADELLELLTRLRANNKFDCLFVQFPTDLQDEFDDAVAEVDFDHFAEAFYRSRKPEMLMAFRYFGYTTEAVQAHIANWLDKSMQRETNYLPANRELLAYLRENKIPLLPFDANSRSREMSLLAYLDARRIVVSPEVNSEMKASIVEISDARNSIMADNIIAKFESHQCTKAVVAVGADHVAYRAQLEGIHGIHLDKYTPLQIRLAEKGFPGAVVGVLRGR